MALYVICGLGNPGKEYENTRHNIGFHALDFLAEKEGISITKKKFHALIGEGRIGSERVILAEPQTYMNASGQAVREIVSYFKIPTDHLIAVYDDFDIPLGSLRIRKFGSAGTHNGMRSIVKELGTEDFPRIRIGTGKKDKGDLIRFVIGDFQEDEKKIVKEAAELAADAAVAIVEQGIDLAMNRYNTKKNKGKNE